MTLSTFLNENLPSLQEIDHVETLLAAKRGERTSIQAKVRRFASN